MLIAWVGTGPVFLLNGVGVLLAMLTSRLSRIVDRARTVDISRNPEFPLLFTDPKADRSAREHDGAERPPGQEPAIGSTHGCQLLFV